MYEALIAASESKMRVVDEDEDADQCAVIDQSTRDENHNHCQPQPLKLGTQKAGSFAKAIPAVRFSSSCVGQLAGGPGNRADIQSDTAVRSATGCNPPILILVQSGITDSHFRVDHNR